MNMKNIILSGLTATACALSAGAQAGPFDYIDYGFGKIDPDSSSSSDDYSSLSGAFQTSAGPFIALETTEYGELDVLAIGAGVYAPVGGQSNVFGMLQYIKADYGNNDETGFRISAGVRTTLTNRVELEGKIKHDDVYSQTDTSFAAALRYYVTPNFSVAANYDTAETNGNDLNAMFASLRLNF
jgi:hypothetical protein